MLPAHWIETLGSQVCMKKQGCFGFPGKVWRTEDGSAKTELMIAGKICLKTSVKNLSKYKEDRKLPTCASEDWSSQGDCMIVVFHEFEHWDMTGLAILLATQQALLKDTKVSHLTF